MFSLRQATEKLFEVIPSKLDNATVISRVLALQRLDIAYTELDSVDVRPEKLSLDSACAVSVSQSASSCGLASWDALGSELLPNRLRPYGLVSSTAQFP